jgi:hypothetical protein
MNKYGKSCAALLLPVLLLLTGSAWSAEPAKAGKETKQEPKATLEDKVLGEVVKVDKKTSVLTVKTGNGQKSFDTGTTQFVGYDSLSSVKTGDKVAILYEEQPSGLKAKVIANHSAMMKMHTPKK